MKGDTLTDFPYYNDRPTRLSGLDWAVVLVALAIGFALLVHPPARPAFLDKTTYGLVNAFLFGAIPLAALAWRVRGHWTAIFNGFRLSYIGWGVLFGIVNLLFTFVIGRIAIATMDLAPNAATAGLASGGAPDGAAMFFLRTGIQLFGEEVITILPFLFLLWLGVKHLRLSRGSSVMLAWIGSALLFAALHLPTYDWHVGQALLLIGPVRLVLTLAYIKTKSMWTSTIAHVFNDWTMFVMSIVLGKLATAA